MKKIILILFLFVSLLSNGQDYIEWISGQGSNCKEYGLLYNYYAASDTNITSGNGWIVPDTTEVKILLDYIDDYDSESGQWLLAGGYLKKTGLEYWDSPNLGAVDSYKYSATGAGFRTDLGEYQSIKTNGEYWTTDTLDNYSAYFLGIYSADGLAEIEMFQQKEGHPIRLVRLATESEQLLDDGQYVDNYLGNDSASYLAVKIGQQIWLAENLRETKLRTGSIIPFHGADNDSTFTDLEWSALTSAGVCAYDNDLNNVACGFEWPNPEFGFLYNAYVVLDVRKISSSDDWVVPDSMDYANLFNYVDTYDNNDNIWPLAGNIYKQIGYLYWSYLNESATNDYLFSAVGGGIRASVLEPQFRSLREVGNYWTKTVFSNNSNTIIQFQVSFEESYFLCTDHTKTFGESIRLCNTSTTHNDGYVGTYTQNDGRVIPTIVINGVEWTMNLSETKYRNGDWIDGYNDGVYTPISNEDWSAKTTGAMCAYGDDETNAINP